ncbi:hypothetical protein ACSFA8_26110 [Variovorax sp. RT4R15]|uniref:hypothetical protein n=1 Tax=Variovorax sp. RT4R15 TaxID=3443737 RepID=UPI003F45DDAD
MTITRHSTRGQRTAFTLMLTDVGLCECSGGGGGETDAAGLAVIATSSRATAVCIVRVVPADADFSVIEAALCD